MSKTFIGGAVCREFESEAPNVHYQSGVAELLLTFTGVASAPSKSATGPESNSGRAVISGGASLVLLRVGGG